MKSTPKCSPNFLSCFQTIEPYCLFSHTTFTNEVRMRLAVSSSWKFMRKPPSPLTVITLRSGCTSLAAIAAGSAKPIPARPLAMMHVFGSWAGYMRPIHSLCRPTSEMRMSSSPSALRISYSARGGCIGKASSSLAASRRPITTSRRREEPPPGPSPVHSWVRRVRMRVMSPTRSTSVTKCSSTSTGTVSM